MRNIKQLGLILSISVNAGAFAASSGTLLLQGVVAATYNISVATDGANNVSLNILGGGSNQSVANVTETANNAGGYKIQASSVNNGLLKNGSIDSLAYTLKYGAGSPVSLTTSAQTVYTSPTLSSAVTNIQNVKVSHTAKPTALAGTFSDTVTLSISAP